MRVFKTTVLASCLVALVGCGGGAGSSDDQNGGGVMPSVSSTKSLAAMSTFGDLTFISSSVIATMFPGNGESSDIVGNTSSSVKSDGTSPDISCSWSEGNSSWNFTCTAWDDQGGPTSDDHRCDVIGSMDPNDYSFEISYDCYNFTPDANITLDGNYTASATMDISSFSDSSAETTLNKGYGKETGGECALEDDSESYVSGFDEWTSTCTSVGDSAPICDAQDAIFTMESVVGSRGVTVTTECGTFVFGSGTTMNVFSCMNSSLQSDSTFNVSGTFNNVQIDNYYNVSCVAASGS